jgi:hypothetical protein
MVTSPSNAITARLTLDLPEEGDIVGGGAAGHLLLWGRSACFDCRLLRSQFFQKAILIAPWEFHLKSLEGGLVFGEGKNTFSDVDFSSS